MGDLFRRGDQIFPFLRPLAQSKQKSHFHLTVVYALKSYFADSNIIKIWKKPGINGLGALNHAILVNNQPKMKLAIFWMTHSITSGVEFLDRTFYENFKKHIICSLTPSGAEIS